MLIINPNTFVINMTNKGHNKMLMSMQKSRMEFLLENKDNPLTPSDVNWAIKLIKESIGIIVSPVKFEDILELYPMQRIAIATYGTGDTESYEAVSFVIANFFGGTRWPVNGDKVPIENFVINLQEYAVTMGFELVLNKS